MTVLIAVPSPTFAHNESVHQRMTDYAYHVMLAAKAHSEGGSKMTERLRILLERLETEHPGMKQFYAAAANSVTRLRDMKSGLPVDDTPCVKQALIMLVGSGAPNWQLPAGTAITDARMENVRLPVSIHYGHNTPVCGLDEGWGPSGVLPGERGLRRLRTFHRHESDAARVRVLRREAGEVHATRGPGRSA